MSPAAPRFGAVVTAMATPFREDGSLDLEGAVRLARHLVEHGSDALVVTGSTGEVSTLADGERIELWRAVAAAVPVPVLAGSTSNDTAHSIELTREAQAAGAAGILAVCPYYNRPSQAGLEVHFRAVAEATSLPVVLYDIPVRTGRKIAGATILRLAREVPNVVALKDAAGDPAATARVLAGAPAGFECYSGDDAMTLPLLAIGAVGLIGVATHWCGRECGEAIARFRAGDLDGALEVWRALLDSFAFESSEDAPNPVPLKAMLRVLGLPAGPCRAPLGPTPSGLEDEAKDVLARLDAWRRERGVG
ncbi:MAG TPA: 4-hydroxy-tetrahydrodipicolinate synthase [Acidimicrobiales bacterium]|nr:4-hydroxy-tetrahydrodipicolinate synthase [Acidimicrobiales bacterium]